MKLEEFQFPSDWKLGLIADWFDFTAKPRGLDLSKNGDEVPFFPMDQIPLGRIRISEFTPKPLAQLGSGTYVENGDLMVAKITPSFENGKQAIVDIETDFAYATTEVIPMRGRNGESDTLFLFFYLLHPEVRSDLAGKMEGSTGRQRLSKAVLGNRLIPLPPLPEQKKIAHILSTVQRAIEAQERIIQTTTELKKALMHKLFTEGLRNEPQKQTEIGAVPESWEVVEIGDLGKCITGATPKTKVDSFYDPPTEDFIAPADLGARRYVYDSEKKISPEGMATIRPIPKNAVMCVCIGSSIGKVGMSYREESATNQQINSIVCDEGRDPEFVYYLLSYRSDYWKSFATFGPVPILSKGRFSTIIVPIPSSLDEQQSIAKPLVALETKVEVAEKKVTVLKGLFRTLLHELMTAKTRVHALTV